jgi:hypothetical protein
MPETQDDLIDRLRLRIGVPDTDVSDDSLNEAVRAALNEYARYRPQVVTGTFPLVAGTQVYPFPQVNSLPVRVVRKVIFGAATPMGAFISDPDLAAFITAQLMGASNWGYFGGSIFENPSLPRIWWQKLDALQVNFEDCFEVLNTVPRTIRLTPVPAEVGTAWYAGEIGWDVGQLLDDDQEPFLAAALWKVAEQRANQLAVMKAWTVPGGAAMQPAFDYWTARSNQYRDQFMEMTGGRGGVLMKG